MNEKVSQLSKIAQSVVDEAVLKRLSPATEVKKFPQQDKFVNDPSPFLAALCTRRAGKTNGLARKFKKAMELHPGSLSRYIALTRDSAKDIMWPVLQEMDETFRWGMKFNESTLSMVDPKTDSRLRLYGADMKNFVRRLRGSKAPAIAVDEAQEFEPTHLENLIDNILTPTLADYTGSWLAMTGTPGPVPRGMFYDVTEHGSGDYSVHKWSLYDNPYLPDPKGFVERLKAKKKWDDRNPTYLREWCGKWVLDLDSLLVRYTEEKNHYDKLPGGHWNYIMGVDLGHKDADAIAIVAWSESTHDIYLVEESTTRGQDITALSNQIKWFMQKYDPAKIVMDEGALGKKIAEEIRRRKHIPVQPAEKQRKFENIAFLNDWLRQGKFKAKKDSKFAQDSYQVQIDHEKTTPDKLVVKKGFHSDIIDAVLYAFKESPAFTYQKPEVKAPYGSKLWALEQETEMERAAEEHFKALEQGSGLGTDW